MSTVDFSDILDIKPEYNPDEIEIYKAGDTISVRASTWALNRKVTKETFSERFRKNSRVALRDLATIAIGSVQDFIKDKTLYSRKANHTRLSPMTSTGAYKPTFIPGPFRYFFHGDLGTTRDSAGFCLSGDGWVWTDVGMVRLKDAPFRGMIATPQGELPYRKVISGKKFVFCIKLYSGITFKATADHKILSMKSKSAVKTVEFKKVSKLNVGDRVVLSLSGATVGDLVSFPKQEFELGKNRLRKVKFPCELTEDIAWLMGYWVGDGWSHLGKGGNRVVFLSADRNVDMKIISILYKNFYLEPKIRSVYKGNVQVNSITYNRRELVRWWDLIGCKAGVRGSDKEVPPLILQSPRKVLEAFLCGFAEADGTVKKSRNGVHFDSSSKSLIEQVHLLLRGLGVSSTMRRIKFKDERVMYRAMLSRAVPEFLTFCDIKKQERVERSRYNGKKVLSRRVSPDSQWDYIQSITECGVEEVYDIILQSEPHAFIYNGVVVHNCLAHYDRGRNKVVVDLLMTLVPQPGIPLKFSRMQAIVLEIYRKGFELVKATFDNWQSHETRERLKDRGIPTEWFSVDKDTRAYDTFYELLLESGVDVYYDETLEQELNNLQLINGKVDHTSESTKDLADACVAACYHCVNDGYRSQDVVDIDTVPIYGAGGASAGIESIHLNPSGQVIPVHPQITKAIPDEDEEIIQGEVLFETLRL